MQRSTRSSRIIVIVIRENGDGDAAERRPPWAGAPGARQLADSIFLCGQPRITPAPD